MRRAAAGIIDGKAVCCGDDGVPSFDLIELNGDDLRARAARGAEEHARCLVPKCGGISHADPTFREDIWARYFTAAPRLRTPSELRYSDRRLRSKS
jgi:hypothetical protein